MSSEPGNESFFRALRPIPRILMQQDETGQVKIGKASPATDFGASVNPMNAATRVGLRLDAEPARGVVRR
jgi:hypothetical protein